MRPLISAFALLLLLPGALPAEPSQDPQSGSDREILIELERGWNDAFYRRDISFIESVLADEFVATYDDGRRGDKAGELALAREFNQRVESAIQDEFMVSVYDDTAVVWFRLNIVGIRDGERRGLVLRFTDVFVRRDGRWQCVSSQSTRVSPEGLVVASEGSGSGPLTGD